MCAKGTCVHPPGSARVTKNCYVYLMQERQPKYSLT